MPYIAIVHIPDDHTADAIIAGELPAGRREMKIVGLYDFPNRSELKCTGYCVRKGTGAWTRDRRGFMKCAICGSRNKRVRQWLARGLFDHFGANKLKREDTVGLFANPEGWDNPATLTDPTT